MFLTHPHLLLSSPGYPMEARVAPMTEAVTGTDHAHPWAVAAAAVAATLPHPMTTTMIAVDLPGGIVHVGMTTAGVLHPASFTTDEREDMEDVRRLVDGCPMSMAHRARAILTILTMPGPDLHPVAMMTHT